MLDIISKSIAASLFIGLGNYVLLKLGHPLGPFLFALGLLGICFLGLHLFTGKCGFWFADHIQTTDLLLILLVNLLAGYLWGVIFAFTDPTIIPVATAKIATWDFSAIFFFKSFLCGVIMYLAVAMYRAKTPLGILLGVPLFIFCGFQHCIANIITLGIATTWHWSLILCIIGNLAGSLTTWVLCQK